MKNKSFLIKIYNIGLEFIEMRVIFDVTLSNFIEIYIFQSSEITFSMRRIISCALSLSSDSAERRIASLYNATLTSI